MYHVDDLLAVAGSLSGYNFLSLADRVYCLWDSVIVMMSRQGLIHYLGKTKIKMERQL